MCKNYTHHVLGADDARKGGAKTVEPKRDATSELDRLKKEAYQEQDAELSQIFPGLSLSSRAEVVSLAQKLKEKEEEISRIKEVLYYFNKLNQRGQQLFLEYLEALAANPKNRKKNR